MKTKHTPGPWSFALDYNLNGRIMGDGGTSAVADVVRYHSKAEANAHLIAAAPEMLEALKLAAEIILPARLGYWVSQEERADALIAIRSAINKAEGTVIAKTKGGV